MIQSVSFGRPPHMPDAPRTIRREVAQGAMRSCFSTAQIAQELENAEIRNERGPHVAGLKDALKARLAPPRKPYGCIYEV